VKTFAALRDSLDSFLTSHLDGLENEQRIEALGWYCQGLGFETEAKTALGLAGVITPHSVQATRQRIQRALQQSRFEHEEIFTRLQKSIFESGLMQAYCIDDTGIAKKGEYSVGVHRQYSGTLGKVGNCQVIVSLNGVSDSVGSCLGLQLYLPEAWCQDAERLAAAKVPEGSEFKKKWEIALALLDSALDNDGPLLPVLADAGYGDSRSFRDGLRERKLQYAVGISSQTNVWKAQIQHKVPQWRGCGKVPTRSRPADDSSPMRVEELAQELEFKETCWRVGTKGPLSAEFAATRVRSAEYHKKREPGEEEWLVVEREKNGDLKYYLCSASRRANLLSLVRLIKMRWHIERDYQDMKQQLGFDKYEGRTWGGLHRHLAMVALLHAFISLHREAFSPSGLGAEVDLQ